MTEAHVVEKERVDSTLAAVQKDQLTSAEPLLTHDDTRNYCNSLSCDLLLFGLSLCNIPYGVVI